MAIAQGAKVFRKGYGVYLAEYRGYGGNPGKPSETGLKQDAQAHYNYLSNKVGSNIVTYGESLGTHLALDTAVKHKIKGVILENAYTTIPALAKKHYPIASFATRLVRDQYNSLSIAPLLKVPVLQLHAENDKIVPLAFGETLCTALPQPKTFFTAKNVGHNNIYEAADIETAVFSFLARF